MILCRGRTLSVVVTFDVNLVLVFPANMPSEGKTSTDSCPFAIDSKLVFLVKLTPSSNGGTFTTSSIGGKNAADFDIVADAYPARRGERFCLSGLVTCRFGRSIVVVVDNLPLSIFFSLAATYHVQNGRRHWADVLPASGKIK
jgi:hypothetical protein